MGFLILLDITTTFFLLSELPSVEGRQRYLCIEVETIDIWYFNSLFNGTFFCDVDYVRMFVKSTCVLPEGTIPHYHMSNNRNHVDTALIRDEMKKTLCRC
jgi:hypothetical protein